MVHIRSTEAKKQCYTIMLVMTAEKSKLLPYVVFKYKTVTKEKFPWGILVWIQDRG